MNTHRALSPQELLGLRSRIRKAHRYGVGARIEQPLSRLLGVAFSGGTKHEEARAREPFTDAPTR